LFWKPGSGFITGPRESIMIRLLHITFWIAFGFFVICPDAKSETLTVGSTPVAKVPRKLRVGVTITPPFMFKNEQGQWTGVSISLWEEVARRLSIPYEYVQTDDFLKKLQSGDLDLCLALTMHPDRLALVTFSQPYLIDSSIVAVARHSILLKTKLLVIAIWDSGILGIFFGMMAAAVMFSALIVFFERGKNKRHFGGTPVEGFASALWFSVVAMTGVGFGDKTPRTLPGRVASFALILSGLLFLSLFTATAVSAINSVNYLKSEVKVDDLSHYSNGVPKNSRMRAVLENKGIPPKLYDSFRDGLNALARGEISAFSGDELIMRYHLIREHQGQFQIEKISDEPAYWAFACNPNLPDLREINREILAISLSPEWRGSLERWTGPKL